MPISNSHRIVTELAAIYTRYMWRCWSLAIEPTGLEGRNYDVLAIRSQTKSIVAIEAKVTRNDFMAGIKKGHFKASNNINEIWLAYSGEFSIQELPAHCGILKLRTIPQCINHIDTTLCCDRTCKSVRNIFFNVKRPATQLHSKDDRLRIFNTFMPRWLWRISTSNATKIIHNIEYNFDLKSLELEKE